MCMRRSVRYAHMVRKNTIGRKLFKKQEDYINS